ncbi:MAG TPA: L-lactate dehydrogenase [Herpetosiphonaceae bacterium]|nr:L-lactate dehydrogenase [Herpetosiphonaceae bacterium]
MAPRETERTRKVGIVGAGMVGSSFAYALMQRSMATDIVLVDTNRARAEGEAMDLMHGVPFVRPLRITAGGYEDLAGADLVVMTAGANQTPGETRTQLLGRNVAVCREVIPQIVKHNPDGLLVMTTNPVDILTYEAARIAGLPPGHVFGSGTILDTARFRALLGDYFDVDPRSVHAYIIGEHGDTELPVWSQANIGGVQLLDYPLANGGRADEAALETIVEQTRTAAYAIIERKKATYYAIGLGLLAIAEAVLRDQRTVLTVSTPLTGQYGVSGVALSLPTVVGTEGASLVLPLELSTKEQEQFHHSAATLIKLMHEAGV